MSKRHGGPGWWCALPDAGAATSVALLLGTVGRVLARHVSGRPWILGREVGAFCTVEADGRRIAVIGDVLATAGCLTRAAASGLEQVLALPGSFHTLISGPEEMTAVGDVCGFRRLFTTRCRQTYVVSSHADVLRRLTAARVNPVWLAARLASPDMPALLRERLAPFVGVEPVPPGWLVEITESRCGTRRWWQPPTAALPADAGAALLRTALARAVGGRADRSESRMGVQLSGGLDSTVLAVLTQKAEPVLVTTGGRSPIADDHHYARRVAASMPSCEHHVVPPEQAPLFFSRLDEPVVSLDEPAPFTAGITRLVFTAHLLRERGVGVCLNGQGGDEVLLAPLAYLGPALRVVPGTGWRHLRGHAALKNIPSLSLARAALRHETFTEWLFRHAFTTCIEPPAAAAVSGWEAPPLLPPWVTDETSRLLASAMTAIDPQPIAEDRTTHAAIARIRSSAARAALYHDAMRTAGVRVAMPYFDRAVVEACLSVHPWERTDPWRPKPLLRRAFGHEAPQGVLARRTKAHYNADIHYGWAKHRASVLDLLTDSRLADLGLVDTRRLRRMLAGFGSTGLAPAFVTELVAIEVWLRDLAPVFTSEM